MSLDVKMVGLKATLAKLKEQEQNRRSFGVKLQEFMKKRIPVILDQAVKIAKHASKSNYVTGTLHSRITSKVYAWNNFMIYVDEEQSPINTNKSAYWKRQDGGYKRYAKYIQEYENDYFSNASKYAVKAVKKALKEHAIQQFKPK